LDASLLHSGACTDYTRDLKRKVKYNQGPEFYSKDPEQFFGKAIRSSAFARKLQA
jgi:hypothetical protein